MKNPSKLEKKQDQIAHKSDDMKKLTDFLSKSKKGYVLITCGHPNEEGKMEVDFSFDGDPLIVSYLMESAQNILDENEAMESFL